MATVATTRMPDPGAASRVDVPTPKQARLSEARAMYDPNGDEVIDDEPDDEDEEDQSEGRGARAPPDQQADEGGTDWKAFMRSISREDAIEGDYLDDWEAVQQEDR